MTWSNFLFFAISAMLISATPGSNMLFAFQCGLNYGLKKTIYAMMGLMLGLFILIFISLFGLSFINSHLPWLLSAVKLLGALYLAYLGIMNYKNAKQHLHKDTLTLIPTPLQLFKTGIWVSLSNPKAILFFVAFFPKFINFNQPLGVQYTILLLGVFVIELFWQMVYAGSGKQLSQWLNTGHRLMWFNRLVGVIFIAIAILLLGELLASI